MVKTINLELYLLAISSSQLSRFVNYNLKVFIRDCPVGNKEYYSTCCPSKLILQS